MRRQPVLVVQQYEMRIISRPFLKKTGNGRITDVNPVNIGLQQCEVFFFQIVRTAFGSIFATDIDSPEIILPRRQFGENMA